MSVKLGLAQLIYQPTKRFRTEVTRPHFCTMFRDVHTVLPNYNLPELKKMLVLNLLHVQLRYTTQLNGSIDNFMITDVIAMQVCSGVYLLDGNNNKAINQTRWVDHDVNSSTSLKYFLFSTTQFFIMIVLSLLAF